jgi:hypothetical protein
MRERFRKGEQEKGIHRVNMHAWKFYNEPSHCL